MAEKNVNEFKGIRIETIQKGNTDEEKLRKLLANLPLKNG